MCAVYVLLNNCRSKSCVVHGAVKRICVCMCGTISPLHTHNTKNTCYSRILDTAKSHQPRRSQPASSEGQRQAIGLVVYCTGRDRVRDQREQTRPRFKTENSASRAVHNITQTRQCVSYQSALQHGKDGYGASGGKKKTKQCANVPRL